MIKTNFIIEEKELAQKENNMKLSLSEKIRIMCRRKGTPITKLAEELDLTSQTMHYKLRNNAFFVKDLDAIARALDAEDVDIVFTMKDGTKI